MSPPSGAGTPDQYEVGDLSGKYGSLKDKMTIKKVYNDSNLPMFGSQSIVGRSIVIHKEYKAERWACSTIGWGWDPDEARQISAIASFHHPKGFAWGYIRFTQVIYNDGSSTDTVMEVRLKYPGKTNQEYTRGHGWSVYVNPVGRYEQPHVTKLCAVQQPMQDSVRAKLAEKITSLDNWEIQCEQNWRKKRTSLDHSSY